MLINSLLERSETSSHKTEKLEPRISSTVFATKQEIRLDFFNPVLDAFGVSLNCRFDDECMTVVEHISSVMQANSNFECAVHQLSKLAKLDGNACVAQGKLLFCNDSYRSPDSVASLQAFASVMIGHSHNITYKNLYALIVYLLTLPVTSATCERAHSKVDIIKSAVRASMTAERLEDMVIISSKKKTLDALSLTAVVDRFALQDRGLPL